MFNPRVFNFKPPPTNVRYKGGNTLDDFQDIAHVIEKHFYNFSINLVIPDCMSVPTEIEEIISHDSDYYNVKNVPLHLLISQDFIDYFVKGGEVTALSSDRLVDSDSTVAVTPDGYLVVSVDYRTYQEIGLIKGPAINIRKFTNSYLIYINLKEECFKIGHKNYDKAYNNLRTCSLLKFELIMTWQPKDESVCPSSLAKFFARHGLEVSECSVESSKRIGYNVKFPSFSENDEDLFEWFGAFLFEMNETNSGGGEEFCTFDTPRPYEKISQVAAASWIGLFPAKRILSLFKEIKKLADANKDIPWLGLSVLGYLDTPISWSLKPHFFRTSGENDYTLLLNHHGRYSLCMNTDTLSLR